MGCLCFVPPVDGDEAIPSASSRCSSPRLPAPCSRRLLTYAVPMTSPHSQVYPEIEETGQRGFVATVGSEYTGPIPALRGGRQPLLFEFDRQQSTGNMPRGLKVDPTTGQIVGIAEEPMGAVTLAVKVTDQNRATKLLQTVELSVVESIDVTWTVPLPVASVGKTYVMTRPELLQKSTVVALYRNTSTLPAGLELDAGNGKLYGTPQAAGQYVLNISAIDETGSKALAKVAAWTHLADSLFAANDELALAHIVDLAGNEMRRFVAFKPVTVARGYTWDLESELTEADLKPEKIKTVGGSSTAVKGKPSILWNVTALCTFLDAESHDDVARVIKQLLVQDWPGYGTADTLYVAASDAMMEIADQPAICTSERSAKTFSKVVGELGAKHSVELRLDILKFAQTVPFTVVECDASFHCSGNGECTDVPENPNPYDGLYV